MDTSKVEIFRSRREIATSTFQLGKTIGPANAGVNRLRRLHVEAGGTHLRSRLPKHKRQNRLERNRAQRRGFMTSSSGRVFSSSLRMHFNALG